jgi:hypothetical protein
MAANSKRDGQAGGVSVLALLYAVVAVTILAAIYAVFIRYNPLVFLSVAAVLVFGVSIGVSAALGAPTDTSWAMPFRLLVALLLAGYGLWTHWLIWIALALDHGGALAAKMASAGPTGWVDFLGGLARDYRIGIGRLGGYRAPVSPQQMLGVWFGEAALVVVTALLGAWASTHDRQAEAAPLTHPEGTNSCTFTLATAGHRVDLSPNALIAAFRRGNFTVFNSLWHIDLDSWRTHPKWPSIELRILTQAADDTSHVIDVDVVENSWDDTGKPQQVKTPVARQLPFPHNEYVRLLTQLTGGVSWRN